MKTRALLLVALLLGLPACSATPPAPVSSPRPLGSGSPPPPGRAVPGMSPSATGSPEAKGPQGQVVEDVALLQLIADPANPLKLGDAEREDLRLRLLHVADAHERVNFRKRALHDAAPDLWEAAVRPAISKETDAQKAFLQDSEDAVEELRRKAGDAVSQPVPLPEHLPPPGSPPVEKPDADASPEQKEVDAVDLQVLGLMLNDLAAEATPEQARKLLPEVLSLQEYVRDMQTRYAELRKAALSTPARESAVQARAAGLSWDDLDLTLAQNTALEWADAQKDR